MYMGQEVSIMVCMMLITDGVVIGCSKLEHLVENVAACEEGPLDASMCFKTITCIELQVHCAVTNVWSLNQLQFHFAFCKWATNCDTSFGYLVCANWLACTRLLELMQCSGVTRPFTFFH